MENSRFAEKYFLTEDQQLLRQSVQEFATREVAPQADALDAHSGLVLAAFLEGGSEKQKREWMTPAVRGEKITSFALTEPTSGSDSGALTTSAELVSDEWVINGQKMWITNLDAADFFVVVLVAIKTPKGQRA